MIAVVRAPLALGLSLALVGAPVLAHASPEPEVQHPSDTAPDEDLPADSNAPVEGQAEADEALPPNPDAATEADAEVEEPVEEPGDPSASPDEEPAALPDIEPTVDDAPIAVPVEELEAEQRAAAAKQSAEAEGMPVADDRFADPLDYDPVRDHPKTPAARRWLGAGIAATVAGAALVGGAIAMSQTKPCEPTAGNNCFEDARNRAAVTMGVPGGLLLLGGIAMTTLGAIQKQRIKASVALAPGHYGFALSARF